MNQLEINFKPVTCCPTNIINKQIVDELILFHHYSMSNSNSPVSTLLRGLFFILTFLISISATWVLIMPTLFIIPLHSKRVISLKRRYIAYISGHFVDFVTYLIIIIGGTKVFIYSDDHEDEGLNSSSSSSSICNKNGSIVICNHRTAIDLMFAGWCYGSFRKTNSNLCLILRDSFRSIPVLGWCMQIMMYIFLAPTSGGRSGGGRERGGAADSNIPHISKMLMYLMNSSTAKPTILLFPEGTQWSPSNVQKSHAFARDKGLPVLNYVLYPKPLGLSTCISIMKEREREREEKGAILHDLTIAYKDYTIDKKSNLNSILFGKFPSEVHLVVKKYYIDDLPTDRQSLDQWLRNSFNYKEGILKEFYENGSSIISTCDSSSHHSGVESSSNRKFVWPKRIRSLTPSSYADHKPLLIVGSWVVVIISLLISSYMFRWIVAIMVMICIAARTCNGIDNLELMLHGDMLQQTLE